MRSAATTLANFVLAFALFTCACIASRSNNITQPDKDEVPTVTACQLLEKPDEFHQKIVRVTGVYENAFEMSHLYDENCKTGRPGMWVNYDKSFVRTGDSEEAKRNKLISGFGRWSVTAVGRFVRAKDPERFGHLGCCRFQFEFIRIEKAEKLPDRKPGARAN